MSNTINCHNLAEHSAQHVFNFIVAHLRTQGVQAKSEIGCAYKTASGLKCAAGCLIPDELYSTDMENVPWYGVVQKFNFSRAHSELIRDFQHLHDSRDVILWEAYFKSLAERFKLEYVLPNPK